jgi:hypothetical protein
MAGLVVSGRTGLVLSPSQAWAWCWFFATGRTSNPYILGGGSRVNSKNAREQPVKVELLKLVQDHVWFAFANPKRVAAIARQMGISPQSATAYMITEHICDEFCFTPKA